MTGPRRDPHLGELASAFADDALDLTTRDRVLVHLAHCAECRAEVDGHRQLKARLAKLETPRCPDSLLDRLRALPETTPTDRATPELTPPPIRMEASFRAVAPAGRPPITRRPVAAAAGRRRPIGRRPDSSRPGGRRLRRSVVATAVGGVAAFAISLSTVVVLGGDQQQPSTVNPPVLTYIKEHGEVTGGVPGGDREASVVDVADTDE
ncbi:anti-sigma factor family protein [Cryptosporangium aurantiacum]|uniref:Putative zinc-finger n=1 Tax=Cryptosporangium aurantiacum TaxID=134849 RepID=A0A1M7QPT0_9ACTN|nr:anti-sigma factor [Cryptosporangium aurantiacum]SHN33543.1 Putative zinc-finger [Cryptosporangium aurantiacum]